MPRHNRKRHQGKSTNNAAQAFAKEASDAAVTSGGPNPSPVDDGFYCMMMMALLIHNYVPNYVLGPYAGSQ
jgi:hypothetical protein